MLDPLWDPSGKAREALRQIVADFGTRALSSPSILDNVLHDLLPDSPKQVSLILATGGSDVATSLKDHVGQGMDPDTAVRLAAAQLAEQTPYDAAGCRWVTAEFARALGYQVSDEQADAVPAAAPTPATAPAPAPVQTPIVPEVPVAAGVAVAADQALTIPPPDLSSPDLPSEEAAPAGGAPAAPRRRRRLAIALVSVVVVVGGLLGGAAATSSWPFTSGPVALKELLPSGVSSCTTKVTPFENHVPGMTAIYACRVLAIKGVVFGYQFDNSSDYLAALNKLNQVSGFVTSQAGSNCPASNSVVEGVTPWYTTDKNLFPKTAGQILECYQVQFNSNPSNPLQSTYLWTIPTEESFMQVIAGANVSMKELDSWWSTNGGPNVK